MFEVLGLFRQSFVPPVYGGAWSRVTPGLSLSEAVLHPLLLTALHTSVLG